MELESELEWLSDDYDNDFDPKKVDLSCLCSNCYIRIVFRLTLYKFYSILCELVWINSYKWSNFLRNEIGLILFLYALQASTKSFSSLFGFLKHLQQWNYLGKLKSMLSLWRLTRLRLKFFDSCWVGFSLLSLSVSLASALGWSYSLMMPSTSRLV